VNLGILEFLQALRVNLPAPACAIITVGRDFLEHHTSNAVGVFVVAHHHTRTAAVCKSNLDPCRLLLVLPETAEVCCQRSGRELLQDS
jgi:hypothetical protein